MNFTSNDCIYMAEAISLASKGLYTTQPNPRVGCVLVKDGVIVGRGWHKKAGSGHAEVNAIADAGSQSVGSTAYVTLEPCSHYGRTPPCAQGLIDAGISKVIAAMQDPNPSVSGNGFAMLQAAGIQVEYGLMVQQARELNPGFIQRMEQSRPWVRIKMAISVDGRTAMSSGESQWITGAAARADVQRLRARSSAIVTGIGTLLHDDAALTVRASELGLESSLAEEIVERQPLRVVLDRQAKMPLDSKLLSIRSPVLWGVAGSVELRGESLAVSQLGHVDVLSLLEGTRSSSLEQLLAKLAELECNELLVEAGAKLAGAFIQEGYWDELVLYMAPKLLGSEARPLAVLSFLKMSEAKALKLKDIRLVGDDIRLTYTPS
jgi:diaminohydroxyphosphoribosylaminopyrimidine deaminase/5-amino-6-(5-phosphoribosylamino)uracil reductase